MTKDETIAYLMDRLQKAEAELDRIRESARVRQSRHRHVTEPGQSRDTSRHGHVTVTLRSDPPPSESNTYPYFSSSGNVPGTDQEETEKVGNSLSGRSRDRHVTFDRERAEQDAEKAGLVGAAFEAELEHFNDYWTSAGWRRKNGPVRDRNATWREWLRSPFRNNQSGNGHRNKGLESVQEFHRLMDVIEGEQVR